MLYHLLRLLHSMLYHLLRLLHSMLYHLLRMLHSISSVNLLQSVLYHLLHLLHSMLYHLLHLLHSIRYIISYICCSVYVIVWCSVYAMSHDIISVALLVSLSVVPSPWPFLSSKPSSVAALQLAACTPPFILKSCSWAQPFEQLSSLNFSDRLLGIFSSFTTQIGRLKCLSFPFHESFLFIQCSVSTR